MKKIEVNYLPNIFTISIGRGGVNIDHYNSLFMKGGEIVPNSLYSLLFFGRLPLGIGASAY